jgi:hypothetical protein
MFYDDEFDQEHGMSGFQDTALVCLNGHLVNGGYVSYPTLNTKHCEKCGELNITTCPECGQIIRGDIQYENVLAGGMEAPPSFCHNCGKPYEWTRRKIAAAQELIALTELSPEQKADFGKSVEQITADTPQSKAAAHKIKLYLGKAGRELAQGIRDIVVDIGAEAVKKTIFGP